MFKSAKDIIRKRRRVVLTYDTYFMYLLQKYKNTKYGKMQKSEYVEIYGTTGIVRYLIAARQA